MLKKLDSIIKNILNELNPKQKRVLIERFGLNTGRPATLQKIGDKLGITRERVRQIEEKTLSKIRTRLDQEAYPIIELGKTYLARAGGVREDGIFINDLLHYLGEKSKTADKKLRFIFIAAGVPTFYAEDENFRSFWYLRETDKKIFLDFNDALVGFFRSRKKEDIFEKKAHLSYLKDFPSVHFASISKRFGLNCFGDFGLCEWEEINPKTIRDKIYLVLKKSSRPLHFNDITKEINQIGFDDKKAHPQTVHNELIKDIRFVLVGRGIYGLREHGYEPGTVREVIANLLKKSGPLTKGDIVSLINEKRFFKEQTILVNLQNRRYFRRLEDGRYHIRQA